MGRIIANLLTPPTPIIAYPPTHIAPPPSAFSRLPIDSALDHWDTAETQYKWTMGDVTGVITAHQRIEEEYYDYGDYGYWE